MGRVAFIIYKMAMYLALPLILARYMTKAARQRTYLAHFAQRFGLVARHVTPGAIWVHAVSVGEVNAAAPLISQLLSDGRRVMLTCTTPTGAAQARKSFGGAVEVCYAPIDAGIFVVRFLSSAKPAALVILETEIWPNMVRLTAKRNIPVYYANMRISDHTFANARRAQALFAHVVRSVSQFNVQTGRDRDRIIELGAEPSRICVTGNLKFDTPVADSLELHGARLRERWGSARPAIILGSSHDGEERIFIETFKRLRSEYKDLVCVIVPRHPERFNAVYRSLARTGYRILRRSEWESAAPGGEVDVVLVDAMGELVYFYSACDIAVVGGSFVDIGGHNVLEPLASRRPVIFGPCMSNFVDVAKSVKVCAAGMQVHGADDLYEALSTYLADEALRDAAAAAGQALIDSNRGALQRTLDGMAL